MSCLPVIKERGALQASVVLEESKVNKAKRATRANKGHRENKVLKVLRVIQGPKARKV